MRRLLRIFLLAAALIAVLCVSALAADEPTVAGLYGFQSHSTQGVVTIVPRTAADSNNEITKMTQDPAAGYTNFYQDAVRFDVTYTNDAIEAGEQYLLLVCSGTGAPSESNIVYINQKAAAADDSVTFDGLDRAYPSSLGKGEYRIYVVGAHSAYDLGNPTAKFSYHVPYKLGDVNDDGSVDQKDAVLVLQYDAKLISLTDTQKLAANVDGKDPVGGPYDAALILQYDAKLITEWPKP